MKNNKSIIHDRDIQLRVGRHFLLNTISAACDRGHDKTRVYSGSKVVIAGEVTVNDNTHIV